MWQSKFIPPAPPADATSEELRYIQQLHDQLTVTFNEIQQVSNQVIIGGDGDGGPGPQATTETDGGSVTYDGSSLSFSNDKAQFVDLSWIEATNTFQSGWRIRNFIGKLGDADTVFDFRTVATQAWDTVTFWHFNQNSTDYSNDVSCNYAEVEDTEDWDPALTAAGQNPITVTPDAVSDINQIEFSISPVFTVGALVMIRITFGNFTNTNNRNFKFPSLGLSIGALG